MDGEMFGPYRIEKLLGRGGMGEVYRAFDESQKRTVALKLLSPHLAADENFRARFRRESELAARLREAHVIPIHRYGEIEHRLFIDMRLVEGSDLGSVLDQRGALPADRAVAIIGQVARALDAAHADGLIHRDVKPSNVLVSDRDEDGDDDFVYLVDFGIARASDDDGQALTKTGSALGSFDYMAPERFMERDVDRRTDVYSLACLLYECLTGRRPFTGDGLPALMYGHLNTPPPRPTAVVPGLPPEMDEVIATGMAKRPDDRYARAGDLGAAARRALRGGPSQPGIQSFPSAPAQPAPSQPAVAPHPGAQSHPGTVSHPGASSAPGTVSQPGTVSNPNALSNPNAPAYRPAPSQPGLGLIGPISNPGQPPFLGSYYPTAGGQSQPGAAYHPQAPPTPPPYRPITSGGQRHNTGPGGPTGPPKKNRTRVLLAVGAVATLVVGGTVVALQLSESGGSNGLLTTTTATSTVTTTVTTTTPSVDRQEELIDLIPEDFREQDCNEREPAGDGDLAAVSCGPSLSQPGPAASSFYLYEDADSVRESFLADMETFGFEQVASFSCRANVGYFGFMIGEDTPGGLVACRVDDDGDAVIQWTQDEFGFYGLVSIAGGGEAALTPMFEWWMDNAQVSEP